MPVRIVRLGAPRKPGEGPRLGTVRRPPRGVAKKDFARLDFYDVWLPELSPSAELVAFAQAEPGNEKRWAAFERHYRREMAEKTPQQLLELLALFSRTASFSVGCYCPDAARCHRSLLGDLLREKGAVFAK